MFRLKIASGPRAGQAIPLTGSITKLGGQADAEADIALEELGQQGRVEIHFDEQNQRLTLHNQGQTELWLNNEPGKAPQIALNSGDELRLGTLRLVVQAPGLRPASVLNEVPARRPIPTWTWVLVAALASSGIAAMALFIATRLN